MLNKPLDTGDSSLNAFRTNNIHKTKTYLAADDKSGVFIDHGQVILSAGNSQIIINDSGIYINGHLTQKDFIESTGPSMTNPAGSLPGTSIPPTIIAAFQKFPDPEQILPFIGLGLDVASMILTIGGV